MAVTRKDVLVIAAVLAVALQPRLSLTSAPTLAKRFGLPSRHLEPVLQALVHDKILKGIRGPRGGYQIGREPSTITAEDILRSARRVDETEDVLKSSAISELVVEPALALAESIFYAALRQVTLSALIQEASLRADQSADMRIVAAAESAVSNS